MGAEHVAVEGVRLAVRRGGPSAAAVEPVGRRVLLLHGAGHTSAIWAPLIEELASDRSVLAVDRRGYGDSEAAPAAVVQEARDYAALLVRVVDEATDGRGDSGGTVPTTRTVQAVTRTVRIPRMWWLRATG